MRGKLCTVPPQIFGDFPAQVDAALAADFLDRACPGWEEDKEVSKQDYSAALQSELVKVVSGWAPSRLVLSALVEFML